MIGRMRVAFERIGLPAWFIVIDLLWIAKPDVLGIDARHGKIAAADSARRTRVSGRDGPTIAAVI